MEVCWCDPCWLTDDIMGLLRQPQTYILEKYSVEWLMALPNSHRKMMYIEAKYSGYDYFPIDNMRSAVLENWEIFYIDQTTYSAYDDIVILFLVLVPRDSYVVSVKSGGMELMSMLSMQPTAMKQDMVAVHANELYPTDPGFVWGQVADALRYWSSSGDVVRVLDLCAGPGTYGIIARLILEMAGYKVELVGIEIDPGFEKPPEFDVWLVGDFREFDSIGNYDLILSNPPFSLGGYAAFFANQHRAAGGVVSFLLPNTFMHSDEDGRGELFNLYPPTEEVKLGRRPSFFSAYSVPAQFEKNRNGTAGHEYCVYQWDRRYNDWSLVQGVHLTSPEIAPPTMIRRQWYYRMEEDNPIRQMLYKRGSMVICALARAAAVEYSAAKKEKRKAVTWDDYISKLCANRWGWDFYHASTEAKQLLHDTMEAELAIEEL